MPIAFVAVAEIVVAGIAAVWLAVQEGIEWHVAEALPVLLLAALNAIAVKRFARRGRAGAGLSLAACGGLLVLAIGSVALWSPWLFLSDGSVWGWAHSLGLTVIALKCLTVAAATTLLTGWGIVLFHRMRRGGQLPA